MHKTDHNYIKSKKRRKRPPQQPRSRTPAADAEVADSGAMTSIDMSLPHVPHIIASSTANSMIVMKHPSDAAATLCAKDDMTLNKQLAIRQDFILSPPVNSSLSRLDVQPDCSIGVMAAATTVSHYDPDYATSSQQPQYMSL